MGHIVANCRVCCGNLCERRFLFQPFCTPKLEQNTQKARETREKKTHDLGEWVAHGQIAVSKTSHHFTMTSHEEHALEPLTKMWGAGEDNSCSRA